MPLDPPPAHDVPPPPAPDPVLQTGLSRVLTDHPAAVLLVDLDESTVVYANELARQLAPGLALPVTVTDWSDRAGLRDDDDTDLATSATSLLRVAGGEPVNGEIVSAQRESDVSSARERLWVMGTPLSGAPEPLGRRALVVFLPVRDQAGVESVMEAGDRLRHRAVVASNLSFSISDPRQADDPLVWVNPAFEEITGFRSADVIGRNCRLLQGEHTDRDVVARLSAALDRGEPVNETLLNYRKDGTAFWNQVVISHVYDDDGVVTHRVGVQTDVTDRIDADAARAEALELARRATLRLASLSAISEQLTRRLAQTTDLFGDVPDVIGEHFDGWIAMYRPTSDADDHAAADVEAETLVVRRGHGAIGTQSAPATDDAPAAVTAAIGAWLAEHPHVTDVEGGAYVDDVVLALDGAPGPWAVIAAAVPTRLETPAVLLLFRPVRGGFGSIEQVAVGDLGRRVGVALDNARLFSREHQVALTLQRSLLPTLPDLVGYEAAAAYIPASDAAAVGGDWYDVLDLPGPWIGVTIGDVMGHDIGAAAAMGQLRSMTRALAWTVHEPADVVARLDELVQGLQATPFATVAYANVDAPGADGGSRMTWANAGHPPPLLRRADGAVTVLAGAVTSPIGVPDERTNVQESVEFHPGDMLIMYTDGLIERRDQDIDDGVRGLAAVVGSAPVGLDAAGMRTLLERHIGAPADDTCFVILRRTPTS